MLEFILGAAFGGATVFILVVLGIIKTGAKK